MHKLHVTLFLDWKMYLHMGNEEMSEEEKEKLTLDECFVLAIEEKAAKLEVTVDYYLSEFF